MRYWLPRGRRVTPLSTFAWRAAACTGLVAATAILPGNAIGQQADPTGDRVGNAATERRGGETQRRTPQQQVRTLSGRVVNLSRMLPPGKSEAHVAGVVETSEGRRVTTALGPASQVDQLDLDVGDEVRVTGHGTRARGHLLFVAHRIEAGGESVAVPHQTMRRRAERTVSGKVVSLRAIELPGGSEPMLVALLERSNGERMVANLGSQEDLQELDLLQGEQVQVTGHVTEVHDRPVLVAHRVETSDQAVNVEHQEMPPERPERVRRLTGEVLELRRVEPPGLPAMILARLSADGQELVANLGAATKVESLELDQGDRIELSGHRIRLHDKPIVIAHELTADDRTIQLDHQTLRRSQAQNVQGTIERMRTVSPPGDAPRMVAALVRETDGGRVSANLGPVSRVRELGLRQGDAISMVGRYIQIHDNPLFIAHQVRGPSGKEVAMLPPSRTAGYRGTPETDREQQARAADRQEQAQRRQQAQRQPRPDRRRPSPDRPRRPQRQPRREIERAGGLGVRFAPNDRVNGALVVGVYEGSPADEAGIRPGDRLMTIGDEYVDRGQEVAEMIAGMDPGKPVRILLRRGNRQLATTARLTTRREALDPSEGPRRRPAGPSRRPAGPRALPVPPPVPSDEFLEDDADFYDSELYDTGLYEGALEDDAGLYDGDLYTGTFEGLYEEDLYDNEGLYEDEDEGVGDDPTFYDIGEFLDEDGFFDDDGYFDYEDGEFVDDYYEDDDAYLDGVNNLFQSGILD